VGWPLAAVGDLFFFVTSGTPDLGFPMRMVRSRGDGSERTLLRPEIFHVAEALWAPDGSLAVIVQYFADHDRDWQVTLTPTDGTPLQVLVEGERIRDLAWGRERLTLWPGPP
jgi:dipeptidyl aminopeptidase/acylaminoacyl peptidase